MAANDFPEGLGPPEEPEPTAYEAAEEVQYPDTSLPEDDTTDDGGVLPEETTSDWPQTSPDAVQPTSDEAEGLADAIQPDVPEVAESSHWIAGERDNVQPQEPEPDVFVDPVSVDALEALFNGHEDSPEAARAIEDARAEEIRCLSDICDIANSLAGIGSTWEATIIDEGNGQNREMWGWTAPDGRIEVVHTAILSEELSTGSDVRTQVPYSGEPIDECPGRTEITARKAVPYEDGEPPVEVTVKLVMEVDPEDTNTGLRVVGLSTEPFCTPSGEPCPAAEEALLGDLDTSPGVGVDKVIEAQLLKWTLEQLCESIFNIAEEAEGATPVVDQAEVDRRNQALDTIREKALLKAGELLSQTGARAHSAEATQAIGNAVARLAETAATMDDPINARLRVAGYYGYLEGFSVIDPAILARVYFVGLSLGDVEAQEKLHGLLETESLAREVRSTFGNQDFRQHCDALSAVLGVCHERGLVPNQWIDMATTNAEERWHFYAEYYSKAPNDDVMARQNLSRMMVSVLEDGLRGITPTFMIDEVLANPSLLRGLGSDQERGRFVEKLILAVEDTRDKAIVASLANLGVSLLQTPGLVPRETLKRLEHTIKEIGARQGKHPYETAWQVWTWRALYRAQGNVPPQTLLEQVSGVVSKLVQNSPKSMHDRIIGDRDDLLAKLVYHYVKKGDYEAAGGLIPALTSVSHTAMLYEECLESVSSLAEVQDLEPRDGWDSDPDINIAFQTARLLHNPRASVDDWETHARDLIGELEYARTGVDAPSRPNPVLCWNAYLHVLDSIMLNDGVRGCRLACEALPLLAGTVTHATIAKMRPIYSRLLAHANDLDESMLTTVYESMAYARDTNVNRLEALSQFAGQLLALRKATE